MNRNLIGVVLISSMTLFIAGCPHHATLYNVNDAPVVVGKKDYSMDEVKLAIVRAGAALGWNMQEVEPGKILGTLHLRSHMAQVDIPYSTNSYSIVYKDSDNLNYDGSKIHSNYNGWIQNLDRGIKTQLSIIQ